MKILIVRMYADFLNIKNYNCQELGLAKALVRKGNICDIVLYTDKKSYEDDIIFDKGKIHIYYLNAYSILKNAIFESKLYNIAKNYDVIQTAEYDQIGNVKLRKKLGNKIVIYHGPYINSYTKGYKIKSLISDIYYLFHQSYKNTPCLSKSVLASDLLKSKGFKNITTVGVGLDTERFKKLDEINNDKISNLIEKKKKNNLKYLLYIGKIEDRRNIPFLIDILEKVYGKYNNVRLVMVGKGEKKYIDKCLNIAEEKNIKDKIIYFESFKQEELPLLYKCCDIFLLPTQYEIFGMVLLEAMYFGMPVLTTLNGGSSTLIEDNKNGFICSLDNIDIWVKVIYNLFKQSKYYENISSRATNTIKNNYTWDKLVDKFLKVYNSSKEGSNI